MTRCARDRRVFFFEEPLFDAETGPHLAYEQDDSGVLVVTPHLPLNAREAPSAPLSRLFQDMLDDYQLSPPVLWYYTPMALAFTRDVDAAAVVYDCMDELSCFAHAPPELRLLEQELFGRADHVLTGGHSLYAAKRHCHDSVHAFPSSVDCAHFAKARLPQADPADQATLGRPRMGFFGVVDERMDTALLDAVAARRPDWNLVVLGPVVKIDPATLPRRPNIHYLGMKTYAELPSYLAGWDVALMPFARNDATRFISPTKTPEYLSGGKPVVSTGITDVVRPYGELGLVSIAHDADGFVEAIEAALRLEREPFLMQVDAFLAELSWDRTWRSMRALVDAAVHRNALVTRSA